MQMVFDHRDEYPSQWKAIESIGEKLNVHQETLRPIGPSRRGRRWPSFEATYYLQAPTAAEAVSQ